MPQGSSAVRPTNGLYLYLLPLCTITFFLENYTVYEIMSKNMVEPDRTKMTIWRMRTACWVPKATNTLSECVIIIAFPLQQWLLERVSMLRYTYIVCLITAIMTELPSNTTSIYDVLYSGYMFRPNMIIFRPII